MGHWPTQAAPGMPRKPQLSSGAPRRPQKRLAGSSEGPAHSQRAPNRAHLYANSRIRKLPRRCPRHQKRFRSTKRRAHISHTYSSHKCSPNRCSKSKCESTLCSKYSDLRTTHTFEFGFLFLFLPQPRCRVRVFIACPLLLLSSSTSLSLSSSVCRKYHSKNNND